LFTQGSFEVGSPIFLPPRRNAGRTLVHALKDKDSRIAARCLGVSIRASGPPFSSLGKAFGHGGEHVAPGLLVPASARVVGKLGVDERHTGAGGIAERAKEKRGLMFLCAVPSLFWCAARRLVRAHGRADQRPERVLVDRFAFADVDCAPDVAIQARVEKA
jgi:hypothetical protein